VKQNSDWVGTASGMTEVQDELYQLVETTTCDLRTLTWLCYGKFFQKN
jgi:hypothetical protein